MGKCDNIVKILYQMLYNVCEGNIYQGHKTLITIFENHFLMFHGAYRMCNYGHRCFSQPTTNSAHARLYHTTSNPLPFA